MAMDLKKKTAIAVAAAAAQSGEEIRSMRVLSFGPVPEDAPEAPYEDRQLTYMKYQLGRREAMERYRVKLDGEVYEIEIEKLEDVERVDPLPEPEEKEEAASVKEKAEKAADSAKEKAGEVADALKEKAAAAREKAAEAADVLKEKAGAAAEAAKEKAGEAVAAAKEKAGEVAGAVKEKIEAARTEKEGE